MSAEFVRSVAGRRRFLKTLGLAGISSAALGPMLAMAADGKSAPEVAKPVAPPASPPPAPDAPPEISEEARALARVVKERYGEHLSAEQLTEIEKELTWRMRAGSTLRKFELGNHDEPDFTFEA